MICKECREESKKSCKRKLATSSFCHLINEKNEKYITDLAAFIGSNTRFYRAIWLKDFIYHSCGAYDLEKVTDENHIEVTKLLAELDLLFKFSVAKDNNDFHYIETKKFYENLLNSHQNTFRIEFVEGKIEYKI